MALIPDWDNSVIDSTSSIEDIVEFHMTLRELEASTVGMLFETIHNYRAVDIGGGGFFYAVEFVNGWRLRFPVPGNYQIIGNINAEIIPTAGVFLTATKALAFSTTSALGGISLTKQDVRNAMTLPATSTPQPGSLDQAVESVGDLVIALS